MGSGVGLSGRNDTLHHPRARLRASVMVEVRLR